MQTLAKQVLQHAAELPEGTPLVAKGLLHLGNRAAVDQVLVGVAPTGVVAEGPGAEAGSGAAAPAAGAGGMAAVVVSVPGQINNRADALAAIDRICDWYDKNEPSHPAPLLLRRAQRLMEMNFMDIVRDLAPDALHQVRALAGVTDE